MKNFQNYTTKILQQDVIGGISVAALSIPVGVAYAEIAGLPPESGIYTAILALIAYFILGSSRQVIIGPDSATVTLFATVVFATAAGNTSLVPQLIMMITVVTGILMFVGGFLKLGFISNFLSKPILAGYLNGVALVLIVSQFSKLTGINFEHSGFFYKILELFQKISLINLPTLLLGLFSILFLYLVKKVSIKIPSQLLLLVITGGIASLINFKALNIVFMQEIKNPYPALILPDFKIFISHFSDILVASAAVMFVSFSGEIPVVQSFAKDKKGFDPNREFYALGLAHILIGFFKGYPISGADSRTAVNVAVGGQTKIVNIIAAIFMLLVILLIPGAFARIPLVTFGAIITFAAIGMFKRGAGIDILKTDRTEFMIFLVCILGVLVLGVYQGILLALLLSFVHLIQKTSHPSEFELVYDPMTHSAKELEPGGSTNPTDELLIYRFNSSLLFFNAGYFSEKITQKASKKANLRLIVIDAKPINLIDLTALQSMKELLSDFNNQNIKVVFTGANERFRSAMIKQLQIEKMDTEVFYPNIELVFETNPLAMATGKSHTHIL